MTAYRFLLLLPLFLFACESETSHAPVSDSGPKAVTQSDSTKATVALKDSLQDTIATKPINVPALSGDVFYNVSYCGGVAPSLETLEELKKYHALKSSVIVLKKDSMKYELKTDADGKFSMVLPEGNYKVFLTKKTKGCEYKTNDVFQSAVATVTLKAGDANKIYFTIPCDISERMRP